MHQANTGFTGRRYSDAPDNQVFEIEELTEPGGGKSYEMVLRYTHLAPDHLSHAAARIERPLGIVEPNSRFF